MMPATLRPALTLGIYPTARGFGWIVFEGPFAPFDWAVVGVKADKNSACLRAIESLIERFHPETLVLEAFERRSSARANRITRLCRAITCLAEDRGVSVAVYRRSDITDCFRTIGAVTRQEIAEAVARHVYALRHRLPKNRRMWESEDKRMSLFNAAALVLTHYRHQALFFLDDLNQEA